MTTDSPATARLPAARPRIRPGQRPAAPSAGLTEDPSVLTASLIGEGPGQYLLACENRESFDGMKAAFEQELRPADSIERMWVDELVDMEWDIHRLRNARRSVVESVLTEQLALKIWSWNSGFVNAEEEERYDLDELKEHARAFIRGEPQASAFVTEKLDDPVRLEDEYQIAVEGMTDTLARLEQSIHAASRMRDALLNRFYGRRTLIADGRIIASRAG